MAVVLAGREGAIVEGDFQVGGFLHVGRQLTAPHDDRFAIVEAALRVMGYGGTPFLFGSLTNGDYRAPTAINVGNIMLRVMGLGWDGAGEGFGGAEVRFVAAEAWVPGSHGSDVRIFSTPNGSAASAEAMRLNNSVIAEDVRAMIRDVTAASLKQISRGAADSGGAGFRVLRIPN